MYGDHRGCTKNLEQFFPADPFNYYFLDDLFDQQLKRIKALERSLDCSLFSLSLLLVLDYWVYRLIIFTTDKRNRYT
jgi:hypothetical protein